MAHIFGCEPVLVVIVTFKLPLIMECAEKQQEKIFSSMPSEKSC
jgi:hypothetical protein